MLRLTLACAVLFALAPLTADKHPIEETQVTLPAEVSIGVGGTTRLVRAIGFQRARQLILTGRMIAAARAAELGLVDEVVRDGAALDRRRHFALYTREHEINAFAWPQFEELHRRLQHLDWNGWAVRTKLWWMRITRCCLKSTRPP